MKVNKSSDISLIVGSKLSLLQYWLSCMSSVSRQAEREREIQINV